MLVGAGNNKACEGIIVHGQTTIGMVEENAHG